MSNSAITFSDDNGFIASNNFCTAEINISLCQALSNFFRSRIAWCTWRRHVSNIRWTRFTNNTDVVFSNCVPVAMPYGVSYIFHRHILSTVVVQSKQVCHNAVCVCIYLYQFLTSLTLFLANFTKINQCLWRCHLRTQLRQLWLLLELKRQFHRKL